MAASLPQDKITAVRGLQQGGGHLFVVGDCVNDAPALAAAHVGMAMGRHGSDLALETADAVVVRDDLTAIPGAIDISGRARRVVTANLVFAATVIVSLVMIDLFGHLPLPLGVAGHEGSTVVVGLNGLRVARATCVARRGGGHCGCHLSYRNPSRRLAVSGPPVRKIDAVPIPAWGRRRWSGGLTTAGAGPSGQPSVVLVRVRPLARPVTHNRPDASLG